MLHEVRKGACDDSFGLNIATIAGFPKDVIENAKRKSERMEKFEGIDLNLVVEKTNKQNEEQDEEDKKVWKKLKHVADLCDKNDFSTIVNVLTY